MDGGFVMDEKGIGLLEVVVTVVLLSLLAAVATVGVNQYLINGKRRIAQSDLKTLAAATRLYLLENTFPASDADFVPATALVPKYLPELPPDPFGANATDTYSFSVTTYNSNPAIRIYSQGPESSPAETYVQ
jgi:Tfp pilus assembly protein PilE